MGSDKSRITGNIKIETLLVFGLGIVFILLILILAIAIPSPSAFQLFAFRLVLSLAAAGIGAAIPGALNVNLTPNKMITLRAGGAAAFFIVVYFINPAGLFDQNGTPTDTPTIEPVISVSPTPAVTSTPTQFEVSIIPPTDTLPPTLPTVAATVAPVEYCLLSDIWHTNILYPPKDSNVPLLFKLNHWGIIEGGNSKESGFTINRTSDKAETNGVFLITYEHTQNFHVQMAFHVTVNELLTTANCGGDSNDGSCAVNLVMGIGNPLGPDMEVENGRYIIFRDLDGIDGWICEAGSLYGESGNCHSPLGENLEDMIKIHKGFAYQILFDLNGSFLNATLNDGQEIHTFFSGLLNEKFERFLWIGYNFRASGQIDAFVSCPKIN